MQADTLIADKAFDADERVIAPLAAAGKTAVIPPKRKQRDRLATTTNTSTKQASPASRDFFAKLKQFRAIATPLRQDRAQLPRRHPPDCRPYLAQLRTGPSAPVNKFHRGIHHAVDPQPRAVGQLRWPLLKEAPRRPPVLRRPPYGPSTHPTPRV